MKYKKIKFTDDEYQLIKRYALAQRKYGFGKGFTIDKAMDEMRQSFLSAVENAVFLDENHNEIDWKH